MDRQTAVDENLEAFLQELPNIPAAHAGKIALLRDRKIVGYYDTVADTVGVANKLYSDGLFSIQQVTNIPVDLGYYSHAGDVGAAQ